MSEWQWDDRSCLVLSELRGELAMVIDDARKLSTVQFQLVDGARTIEEQRQLFRTGKSKINPDAYGQDEIVKVAKHVVNKIEPKARAVDIVIRVAGKPALGYDRSHICFVAGVVMAVGKRRGIAMRWGGNWDGDGEIITDQTFQDLVHFELD
jgi:peptidoglycan L-alanyl-D-glutamate endopeptidase CwlK